MSLLLDKKLIFFIGDFNTPNIPCINNSFLANLLIGKTFRIKIFDLYIVLILYTNLK